MYSCSQAHCEHLKDKGHLSTQLHSTENIITDKCLMKKIIMNPASKMAPNDPCLLILAALSNLPLGNLLVTDRIWQC